MTENGTDWTPYGFTFNNPIKYVDPDGRWAGLSDATNARAQEFFENSIATGNGNVSADDGAGYASRAVRKSDIKTSFSASDLVPGQTIQGVYSVRVRANYDAMAEGHYGTLYGFTAKFKLFEVKQITWRNSQGQEIGVIQNSIESQHSLDFSTDLMPIFKDKQAANVFQPIKLGFYTGEILTDPVIGKIRTTHIENGGWTTEKNRMPMSGDELFVQRTMK